MLHDIFPYGTDIVYDRPQMASLDGHAADLPSTVGYKARDIHRWDLYSSIYEGQEIRISHTFQILMHLR